MARRRRYKPKEKAKKPEEAEFEEVVVACANCGKKMKVIKVHGLNTEGMLCQSCGAGETKADTG